MFSNKKFVEKMKEDLENERELRSATDVFYECMKMLVVNQNIL